MTIISGICPVEHLGAGRVIRFIESELPRASGCHHAIREHQKRSFLVVEKELPAAYLLHAFRRVRLYQKLSHYSNLHDLVLMHFQEIGFDW